MKENFKIISEFPDYKINIHGDVYNKKNKLVKTYLSRNYPAIKLTKNKKRYTRYLHRLIFQVFNNNSFDKNLVINHKNGNTLDFSLNNLECITQKENIIHSRKITKNGSVISRKKILELYNKNKFNNAEEFLDLLLRYFK